MEAKLSSLPMAERNMLARVMNDIDEDQVRHLDSTSLDSACSLRPISSEPERRLGIAKISFHFL